MIGLKVEDAIKLNNELKKYSYYKNGKLRLDFKNKECIRQYNKTLLKHIFNIDLTIHKDALVPTPLSRYLFIKTVFDKYPNIKKVLEVGSGSGIIALMIKKYYNCEVDATETVDDYIKIIEENSIKNSLKINIIPSNGRILDGINYLKNKKYDLIISYPPYYAPNSVPSKKSFGGAYAKKVELIGGGKYGEGFSVKLIEESPKYLSDNGVIALMLPEKTEERRLKIIESMEKLFNVNVEKIKTGKRTRYIITGQLKKD